MRDTTGNLPPLPGVFPDYMAPIVPNAPDGVRELMMARWGMPSSQFALMQSAKQRAARMDAATADAFVLAFGGKLIFPPLPKDDRRHLSNEASGFSGRLA